MNINEGHYQFAKVVRGVYLYTLDTHTHWIWSNLVEWKTTPNAHKHSLLMWTNHRIVNRQQQAATTKWFFGDKNGFVRTWMYYVGKSKVVYIIAYRFWPLSIRMAFYFLHVLGPLRLSQVIKFISFIDGVLFSWIDFIKWNNQIEWLAHKMPRTMRKKPWFSIDFFCSVVVDFIWRIYRHIAFTVLEVFCMQYTRYGDHKLRFLNQFGQIDR